MHEDLGKTEASLIAARRDHLAALRSRGFDPFAQVRYDVDATAQELHGRYGFLEVGQKAEAEGWNLAGRLMSIRTAGKTLFADLHDRTGRLQIYVRKDDIGDDRFAQWNDIERGDIVGVRGYMFRSKKGDLTLHVTSFELLSKSLMPLPDKWHGLVDVEKRYRQRYVDLIVNRNRARRDDHAQPDPERDASLHRLRRILRSGDADVAARGGRRFGASVPHPRQRALG